MVAAAIAKAGIHGKGEKVVCVTGASGFVGSWLVMRLLERGYVVRATVREPNNMKKVNHLLELPNAMTHLTLWKADMNEEGSFDEAINGCQGVFHVATPMDFDSKDPEKEVIQPTINGMLDIMKSCVKAKVKKLVFTSSAGTVDIEEHNKPVYDENSWTDVDFCRRVKMTGWMYFVSKTLAEQSAWKFAEKHNLNFISIIPTLVVGPFITPTFPPSLITALSPITRTQSHYHIIEQGHYVHLDDLCMAHIYLYEKPDSHGRYICNSHDKDIFQLANLIRDRYPEYKVDPKTFKDTTKQKVEFSSKKLVEQAGFKYMYSFEDMIVGAVDTCRKKSLLPFSFNHKDNNDDNFVNSDAN